MRRLVCHGYEILPSGQLGSLCDNVCRLIAQLHPDYDQILLLAGQHLKGVDMTVDRAMKTTLIEYGVPASKLIAWSDLCPAQRPPRDTMEEVDLVPVMLRALGCQPQMTEFDVACIWYFRWRIQFLFSHRGAHAKRILGAHSLDIKRMAIEFIAFWATIASPTGESRIFQKNRADRNVFPTQEDGTPWIDNLPSSWEV